MSDAPAGGLPLAGVRVLEMLDKAEMCGRFLADLGATVIKLEPLEGSVTRRDPPCHDGISVAFAVRNANKQSVSVDLATEAGKAVMWRLLGAVDIWMESTRPGQLASLGFSVADVRARFPRLVVVSITDFGQFGPYRDYVGSPWVITAMCGFLSLSGIGDREPLMPPAALPAEAAAAQAMWATLAGLWHTLETGTGDHIDLSILEAAGQILDPAMGMSGTASAGAGVAAGGPSRQRPVTQVYPIFPCADGFVRVVILSPRQWRAMRAWLGEPEELMDDSLDQIYARYAKAEVIGRHIRDLFRERRMMELVDEGQARGVACAPALDLGDVIVADHFLERGALVELEIADGVSAIAPNGFVEYDGARLGIRASAPAVGEHGSFATEPRHPPAVNRPVSGAPLTGLRVLDLGVIVYGAEVGRLFADLGADVIKVENSAFPDGGRVARGGSMYPGFAAGHRNKRGIGLNLRCDEGKDLFKRLVAESDVVLSNFKPGTLESLGLGYAAHAAVNPGIVMLTSSAMGSSGPWAEWMGYGPLVRCVSGLSLLWRYPDDDDSFADATTMYPDHYAARVMATAGLAALIARRESGRGAHIEGAQAEAILMELSELVALESVEPGSATARGNSSSDGAPWGVYRCAGDDEWCVITVRDDSEWCRLCAATELPDLVARDEFATVAGRLARKHELDARISEWTSRHSPREVQSILQSAGVAAGAMLRVSEMANDPHLVAREYLTQLEQPGLGPVTVETRPFLSEQIAPPRSAPAPEFGQHTREVFAEVLGLGDDEIEALVAAGVLEASS